MVLIEQKWAIMASKYKYRINADEASNNKLVKFV